MKNKFLILYRIYINLNRKIFILYFSKNLIILLHIQIKNEFVIQKIIFIIKVIMLLKSIIFIPIKYYSFFKNKNYLFENTIPNTYNIIINYNNFILFTNISNSLIIIWIKIYINIIRNYKENKEYLIKNNL